MIALTEGFESNGDFHQLTHLSRSFRTTDDPYNCRQSWEDDPGLSL